MADLLRTARRCVGFAAVAMLVWSAGVVWGAGRTTDDPVHDLVEALTARDRWDDAEWVCRNEIRDLPEGRFEHSKWTARLALVVSGKNTIELFGVRSPELPDRMRSAIENASQPIDELLSSYPELKSVEFLLATKLHIRRDMLRSAIIAASVSPPDDSLIDQLLRQISQVQQDADDLHRRVKARWSDRTTRAPSDERGEVAAGQYQRLMQELAIGRVSIAMLQTELFVKNSPDYRTAAVEAVALAEEAVLALPDGSSAKLTARALLAESRLRSGDLLGAEQLIGSVGAEAARKGSPTWTALQVRYQLAKGDPAAAGRVCDAFYQSLSPDSAAADVLQMDFAKLEVLLANSGGDARVSAWIDTIGRRGGAFARRRAESIAVAALRLDVSTDERRNRPGINPALIAAQGEDWLRRNDPLRAASLLREAALAERRAERAFEYAAKSAASAISGKDRRSAIEVLRSTARKHASDPKSSTLMMQAALIATEPFRPADDPNARVAILEDTLQEVSQTWPKSDSALKGNAWFCKMLADSGRESVAANVALELLTLRKAADQLEPAMTRVYAYLSQLGLNEATSELKSYSAALSELARENRGLRRAIFGVASWLFDRNELRRMSSMLESEALENEFLGQLASFRLRGNGAVTTEGVDPQLLKRARWRLERDALLERALQRDIGALLLDWPEQTPWEKAQAEFWESPGESSINHIKRLVEQADDPIAWLRRASTLLVSSDSKDAKRVAVDMSDRLASSMKIGSGQWYEEKLRAIGWLRDLGRSADAVKRAKYVLLLHRPEDEGMRKRFEAFAVE